MTYIIRTAKELEVLRIKSGEYWLGQHMYICARAIISNPIFKMVDGYEIIVYKDFYWHPETYRPLELNDVKDIVYLSRKELKEIKA